MTTMRTTGKSLAGSVNSALQYVENFSNPYVKIVLVCKICSKEMSLKFSSNWKKHYLTHSSDAEKPHKCTICSKAFISKPSLRNHTLKHHNTSCESISHSMVVRHEDRIKPKYSGFLCKQEQILVSET